VGPRASLDVVEKRNMLPLPGIEPWPASSSAGTAMDYGLEGRGSIPGGSRNFSLFHSVQIGSEAHKWLLGDFSLRE
jgi:hypothetical protein